MGSATENRIVQVYIDGQQAGKTLKELRVYRNKLNNEINAGILSEDQYQKKVADLRKVDGALQKHRDNVSGINRTWQKTKEIFAGVLGANLATSAITKFFNFIPNLLKRNAELSDSYADIAKTTGMSEEAVRDLDKELKKFNTRTSRDELRKLAYEAGKVGKTTKEEVVDFVKQANIINVALGEDLGNSIRDITKSSTIFKTEMLNIASSINTVGASSVASEGYLVDFLARLSGIADTAEISAPDIIGYGAALDAMGQRVEMSSTALNTFFIDFVKNTELYGKAAGYAKGELSALIGKEGTNEGFLAFLQRLKESSASSEVFLKKLEDLGIDGARGSQVFLALSNNIDLVRQNQEIANDSFDKGTSVIDEYNIKNNNLAATLEKIGKWFGQFFTNGAIVNGLTNLVNQLYRWIEVPLSETMEADRMSMLLLEAKILDVNTSTGDRIKLINELKTMYPDYLGHIDAETISNSELQAEINKVNEALINKIILQEKDEEIESSNEKLAKARMNLIEQEDDLRKRMIEMADEQNIELKEGLSLLQQARQISNSFKEKGEFGRLFSDKANLAADIRAVENAQNDLNTAQWKTNTLLEKREELMKRLGMNAVAPTPDADPVPDSTSTLLGGGVDDKFIEEQKKKLEELNAMIEEKRIEVMMKREDDYNQQLIKLNIFYDRMRELAGDNATKLEEINLLHQEEMDAIKTAFDEEELKKEEEKEQKRAEKRLEYQSQLYDDETNEMIRLNDKYDRMRDLAEGNNDELLKINERHQEEMLALEQDFALRRIRKENQLARTQALIYKNMAESVLYAYDAIAGEEGRYSAFRRIAVVAQLAADTAAAIGSLTRNSAADPMNAVTGGLAGVQQFTTGLARILANIAMATKYLEKSKVPAYELGSSFTRSKNGMSLINEIGPEMVQIPDGSRVFTAGSTLNILREILSGSDRGLDISYLQKSGSSVSSTGTPEFNNSGAVELELQMVRSELMKLREDMRNGLSDQKVIFVQQDYDEFQKDLNTTKKIANFKSQ